MSNSNRLQNVLDLDNDTLTNMGDFRSSGLYMRNLGMSKTISAADYSYDGNGNMYIDNNKDISNIHYNYLNLPDSIVVTNKGFIKYVYDAAGTKIKKIATEGSKVTTTMYLFGNYVNDTLQFLPQEEGRIRFRAADGSFQYDYFLKDHLSNVRMVLTEQKDTAKYLASMESAYRSTENALFYNIPASSCSRTSATGYPVDHVTTNPNDSVIRVNGSGQKVGPAIILKVMAGDKVDIGVNYYYNSSGATNGQSVSVSDIINSLANGIVSVAGPSHGSAAFLSGGASPLQGALSSYLSANNPTTTGKPNAYLNWILLDNQFNYVSSYPQSGALQVGASGTQSGGTLQTPLGYTGIPITKSGFLYIYVSNATPSWDVFFDNLSVKTYAGPMLEENHYYPFGLTMAGISDKAIKTNYAENKLRYNGKELQNQEFSDGSGLEEYDYGARYSDPQIGRFWEQDKFADKYDVLTPYQYGADNPLRYVDMNGDSLRVGGNIIAAINDLLGLLPHSAWEHLSYSNGQFNFSTDGLSDNDKDDEGVKLISHLSNDQQTFSYSVSDEAGAKKVQVDPETGRQYNDDEVGIGNTNPQDQKVNLTAPDQHGILNAANALFGSVGTYKIDPKTGAKQYSRQLYPSYFIPSESTTDGAVTIAEHGTFLEQDGKGGMVQKSRSSVVFHELSENYYRVQGQSYYDAHNSAVVAQRKFSSSDVRRSIYPGVGNFKR